MSYVHKWQFEGETGNKISILFVFMHSVVVLLLGKWLMYDEQSQAQLENNYQSGAPTCQININGVAYEINFKTFKEIQSNDRNRMRNIRLWPVPSAAIGG